MKFIREALYNALHEVLLCNLILAAHNLLHHASLYDILHIVYLSRYDVAIIACSSWGRHVSDSGSLKKPANGSEQVLARLHHWRQWVSRMGKVLMEGGCTLYSLKSRPSS